jgi:hypothetical protein
MKKTNFDKYLKRQFADPAFAARFKRADKAWDTALRLSETQLTTNLRQKNLH